MRPCCLTFGTSNTQSLKNSLASMFFRRVQLSFVESDIEADLRDLIWGYKNSTNACLMLVALGCLRLKGHARDSFFRDPRSHGAGHIEQLVEQVCG